MRSLLARALVLLGPCLVALACGGAAPPVSAPSASESPAPVPAPGPVPAPPEPASTAEDACDVDADCVAVETACCDHCNGGSLAAYNRAHADKHRKTGCEDVYCTMRACGPAVARCVDHRCEASVQPLVPGG